MLDNFSKECSKNVQSEILLSKTATRQKLIADMMEEAENYGFDGFNLDFESLKPEAMPHYVQFIREMSIACRERGLVLSVDNYVPSEYTADYNRKEQGIVADYVIIMGYDEHYAGGEKGSTASIEFVEKGITDTLLEVPKEKIINAVPFYTRQKRTGRRPRRLSAFTRPKSGLMRMTWSFRGRRIWGNTTANIRNPKRPQSISGWKRRNRLALKWI